jgi:glutathione-regulated potassium-efflux system ancillary protein KefG
MKIMVIIAHPNIKNSRANQALTRELQKHTDIYIHHLYQAYTDWHIEVEREQQLLLDYDRIIFQFPLYWFSCPPLLKKWFDDVFTFGWAYGPEGKKLKGKQFMIAVTAGGTKKAYRSGGDNWFTISEYVKPIQSTITKCNGTFLPAFVVYNSNHGTDEYLAQEAQKYVDHIQATTKELVH